MAYDNTGCAGAIFHHSVTQYYGPIEASNWQGAWQGVGANPAGAAGNPNITFVATPFAADPCPGCGAAYLTGCVNPMYPHNSMVCVAHKRGYEAGLAEGKRAAEANALELENWWKASILAFEKLVAKMRSEIR